MATIYVEECDSLHNQLDYLLKYVQVSLNVLKRASLLTLAGDASVNIADKIVLYQIWPCH